MFITHVVYCDNYILRRMFVLMQVFTEQLLELHKGQGMDIYWRDSYICPSEEQYKLMVKRSMSFII